MIRFACLTLAMVVGMFGVFPDAAIAQPPPDAGNNQGAVAPVTSQSSAELWHQAPKGLSAWEGAPEWMKGDVDGHISLQWGVQTFRGLEGLDGTERNYDRSVFRGEGELSFVLNPDGVKTGGNPYRLGLEGEYEYASDNDGRARRSFEGIDLLDYFTSGGRAFLDIRSSNFHNKDWSYHLRVGSGASYVHWGKFYGVMWDSHVALEGGLRVGKAGGLAIGPIAGVDGRLMVGEHNSNWMLGEATLGIQGVSQSFTFRADFLTTAGDRDCNTVTGNYGKVEEEWVHMGARLTLIFGQSLEFGVEWSHSLLHRFKVDVPGRSYSSDLRNEGNDVFSFHMALRF